MTRFVMLFAACVLVALPLSATALSQEPLSVTQAIDIALQNNAELKTLAGDVRKADARLDGASLLLQANPELSGSVGPRLRSGSTQVDFDVELSQQLEIFGQRGARIDSARAGKAQARALLKAKRVEVAAAVRQTFVLVLATDQNLSLARANLELAKETVRATEQKLELGDGSRIEVNTARADLGRAARALSVAVQQRAEAEAQLRGLLALEPTAELRLQGDLRGSLDVRAAEEATKSALKNRAERLASTQAIEQARADQRSAERAWLPKPRIGLRYEREEGDDVFLGTFAFDLPTFNQNQEARGVAAAEREQAEVAVVAVERRIEQEVLLAASRLTTAREAAKVFEGDILAGLQENLKLVGTAYAAGKIDLFQLLLIRRDTIDAQRGEIEATTELRLAEIELARALGLEEQLR